MYQLRSLDDNPLLAGMAWGSGAILPTVPHRSHTMKSNLVPRSLRLGLAALALLVGYFVVPMGTGSAYLVPRLTLTLVAIAVLGVTILYQLRNHTDAIGAVVLLVMLVVFAFALVFLGVQKADPSQFVGIETRVDALYYTLTTITTTGYGDVHARGQLARGLVTALMAFNMVVFASAGAAILARLGSLPSTRHSSSADGDASAHARSAAGPAPER